MARLTSRNKLNYENNYKYPKDNYSRYSIVLLEAVQEIRHTRCYLLLLYSQLYQESLENST